MPDSHLYCFISYSRRDSDLARWLQRQLESYKYPAALVGAELRPPDPVHLRPIFLDTSDLPVSTGKFWDDICAKLDLSRYLLVLCSRAAAASEYVDREIVRFINEDEGRLENIILAIVDPQINLSSPGPEDFPPQIFQRWSYFTGRNHVLIRPAEDESPAAARQRGLMQIISFMLRIEWTVLYNRHLIARRKSLIRIALIGLVVFSALSILLVWAWWNQHELAHKERELAHFERKIFPYSLVVGYVDNFLSPVIDSLEADPARPFIIIIVMPNSYRELDHNGRVERYRNEAGKVNYKAELKKVKTILPRGAEIAVIVPTPPYYLDKQMDVYVDFASTVAAFRPVIEYKKENAFYAEFSEDKMVCEYGNEFEDLVKWRLEYLCAERQDNVKCAGRQDKVKFVRSLEAAFQVLDGKEPSGQPKCDGDKAY